MSRRIGVLETGRNTFHHSVENDGCLAMEGLGNDKTGTVEYIYLSSRLHEWITIALYKFPDLVTVSCSGSRTRFTKLHVFQLHSAAGTTETARTTELECGLIRK